MATETIPSSLIISDVTITNEHRTYVTESISGKFTSRDSGVQRFKGTITLTAPDGFRGAQTLNGFLARLKGRLNTFNISLGGAYTADTLNTNPLAQSSAAIGSESIIVNNISGEIYTGQVFNIDNDTKVYTALNDILGISGVLDIVPALRIILPMTSTLNFLTPSFDVILNGNDTTIEHGENGLVASATLEWTEAL